MARLIFDLDGTLVDSAPDIHATVNFLLAEMGQEPMSLATVTSFIGNGAPVLLARVLDSRGFTTDAKQRARVQARFLEIYEANSSALSQLYPGVAETLRLLASQGHSLGLCTNKPERPTHLVLKAFGLTDVFSAVVGGDSLPQRKPDPAPLWAVAAAMPEAPIVYVGDSEVDAATAVAAAVPFLLFTKGYRNTPAEDLPAAAMFNDFADLPGLVDSLVEPVGRD